MKNKQLAMVDIMSAADKENKPLGHGIKVGNEYYGYIRGKFEIIHYVNRSVVSFIDNSRVHFFKVSHKHGESNAKRIITYILNLLFVYLREQYIWFYVPDIYIFLFLLLFPKNKHKIAVSVYEDYSSDKIKNWIFLKAIKKIDILFVTNNKLSKEIENSIYVPDYAYDENFYSKYIVSNKEKMIISLGTMNGKKLILQALHKLKTKDFKVYVAGQFIDRELFNSIKELESDSIVIEDRYIENDEYYKIIASSMFCILPYDPLIYRNRTSGILQECLFLKSIPIAPKELLDTVNIPGIGYSDIRDLSNIELDKIDISGYEMAFERIIKEDYSYNSISDKVLNGIERLFD